MDKEEFYHWADVAAENVIREKDILMIDGVPHAQVYFLI